MSAPIQLIVGLGNPGKAYADTRHNAGAWYVEQLAEQYHASLRLESKFQGAYALLRDPTLAQSDASCHLLIPSTFMNDSGRAVKAVSKFYKIPSESILIVHDELDLPPGVARLKQAGGHGGHNGLRDIIQALGTKDFSRLRVGIGHPGHRDRVHDYVLSKPSRSDQQQITTAIQAALQVAPMLMSGALHAATQQLHTA